MIQLQALAAAGAIALAAAAFGALWSRLARRRALLTVAEAASKPYILYFSTSTCSICRTHQEPALRELDGVGVRRIDAIAEPEMARRYSVYSVPATVVVAADGRTLHVNYGFAPAARLRSQLAA